MVSGSWCGMDRGAFSYLREQIALRNTGCPVPGYIQSQAGGALVELWGSLLTAGKLGQMSFRDPFQLRRFCKIVDIESL